MWSNYSYGCGVTTAIDQLINQLSLFPKQDVYRMNKVISSIDEGHKSNLNEKYI